MIQDLAIRAKPTDTEATADGVRCRVWEGEIEAGGGPVQLLVWRVLSWPDLTDQARLAGLAVRDFPTLKLHDDKESNA